MGPAREFAGTIHDARAPGSDLHRKRKISRHQQRQYLRPPRRPSRSEDPLPFMHRRRRLIDDVQGRGAGSISRSSSCMTHHIITSGTDLVNYLHHHATVGRSLLLGTWWLDGEAAVSVAKPCAGIWAVEYFNPARSSLL